MFLLVLISLSLISIVHCQTLYDSLNALKFLNEGFVSNSDIYQYQSEYSLYSEPENATRARFAWAQGPIRSYLYQTDPLQPLQCTASAYLNETNYSGANFLAVIPPSANPEHCTTFCCQYMSCAVWVYTESAPQNYLSCEKGKPCCYLKSYLTTPTPSTVFMTGIMNRTFPYNHPPTGLRSAVPLGGVTTGSIELRADGTFHEWTIENQSPATGTKYGVVDDALLAFRIQNLQTKKSDMRVIRTHPSRKFNGIQSIKYHGAYPVSKFEFIDETLMANMNLYAYSAFKAADLNRSMTPAIIFSLNVENTNSYPIEIDFMYNAPLSVQIDQSRQSNNTLRQILTDTYTECLDLCTDHPTCASWNWQSVNNQSVCILYSDVQYNEYLDGCVSGIRGDWTYNQTGPLILNRPSNASFALWPVASVNQTMSATIDNDLNRILNDFSNNGGWSNSTQTSGSATNGAVSISTILQPGEKRTLSIVFAWYFPHHTWLDSPLDNYYSLLFTNVTSVGQSIGIDKNESQLSSIVNDISTLHNIYLNTTLPDYLVDSLINSVSHMRSAMYFSNGDWRQWEAYDCNDVDSVHNDHQRHLPYLLYFPQTEKTKMYAWAKYQLTNGMIQESFTTGCTGSTQPYDHPGGRQMGDVTTIFILETLEFYRWTNDRKFLDDMYPHVVAGLQWQLNVSSKLGLPENLECTYDIPDMSQYPTTTFNSFMYLSALKACLELTTIMNDSITFSKCYRAFNTAVSKINGLLWYMDSDETGYFLAYTGGKGEKAIFTDALYGQVLAFTYGLGTLFDSTMMKKHLDSEVRLADTPYGLRMLTGREPLTNPQDNTIWMGASQDWSVLNLWLNTDVDSALIQSRKGLNHVREILRDQWNVHGLYAGDGYGVGGKPWVTSHYGFHMVLWHLPFALSGQYADLSKGILTFTPKVRSPFILPVLLPNTFGSIGTTRSTTDQKLIFTFTLIIGNLNLGELSVNNIQYPGTVNLTAGQSVQWNE